MRKALIAVVVASALFAVGAFAASFTQVQSEDVASGGDGVSACAGFVDIDFGTPTWEQTLNSGNGDWTVNTATITFYSAATLGGTPTVATACEGFDARAVVQVSTGTDVQSDTDEVVDGKADVSFTATQVGLIDRASALVDGQTLFADPTP